MLFPFWRVMRWWCSVSYSQTSLSTKQFRFYAFSPHEYSFLLHKFCLQKYFVDDISMFGLFSCRVWESGSGETSTMSSALGWALFIGWLIDCRKKSLYIIENDFWDHPFVVKSSDKNCPRKAEKSHELPNSDDKFNFCGFLHAEVSLFIKCFTDKAGKDYGLRVTILYPDNEGYDIAENHIENWSVSGSWRECKKKTNPMSRTFSVEKWKDFNEISQIYRPCTRNSLRMQK